MVTLRSTSATTTNKMGAPVRYFRLRAQTVSDPPSFVDLLVGPLDERPEDATSAFPGIRKKALLYDFFWGGEEVETAVLRLTASTGVLGPDGGTPAPTSTPVAGASASGQYFGLSEIEVYVAAE